MRMVIAGAGLVGCALAIALKQKGFEVELYEKRSDPRLDDSQGGRSINLIVTAKAINLFKNLNIWEHVKEITVPVFGRMMHSKSGDLTYQPYGKDDSEFNYSISRGMFNSLLLDQAERFGVPIYFEHSLERVDFNKKIISFDKLDVPYDILYGCDGAGSRVRQEMLDYLGGEAKYQVDPLGVDYKEFLMPAKEDGAYAIDERALHIWPRGNHFLMALPNLAGSFTMTLYMPTEWFSEFNSIEKIKNYFDENYADSLPLMPNFETEFQANPQGFLGTVRMDPWTVDDSVLLLGDAAHAIVPFFGQGMNCGMSDVQFILEQLGLEDWNEICKRYQDHQKLNGDAIADLSLENFIEMSDKVGDERFLFKKKVEKILENHFPEKYRSRYAMTVYTLIPYHFAKAAGEIQKELLEELTRGLERAEDVDLEQAERLIDGMLTPWFRKRSLSLKRFPIE